MIRIFNYLTRPFIFFVMFICPNFTIKAQQANGIPYSFTVTASTPPSLPAGFTNISVAAASQDEGVTFLAPSGWSFTFANQTYTKVVVSTNGWVALVPSSFSSIPTIFLGNAFQNNQLNNNTTGYPIIAPLWDNLTTQFISYIVSANALWIRWTSKWQTPGTLGTLVWLKLDGANNSITFDYANLAAYVPVTPSASIGIAGACTGDFYSVSCQSNNSATIDSEIENTSIGTGGPNSFRPYNCYYTFTPNHSYNNCSGIYPARDLGTITGLCSPVVASTFNATASGSGNCAITDVMDTWFKFIKPINATDVTITTSSAICQSVSGTSVEVYSACGVSPLSCATTSSSFPGFGEVVLTRPCSAETLYVRVTSDGDVPGNFQICAKIGGSSGTNCSSPTSICTLPFSVSGLSTAGSNNDYDALSSACRSTSMNGEDYVFSYTPTSNECIQISMTSSGNNAAVFVYSGCPNSTGTYCLGSAEELSSGQYYINSVTLTAGQTYYIIVDNDTTLGNQNVPFDIYVTSSGTNNSYDACASAINLGAITNGVTCMPQTFSTECSTPSVAGTVGIPSCIPAHNPPYFIDGVTGDVWLKFTAIFSGTLLINIYQSVINPTSNAAMAVYLGPGCPGTTSLYACDYNSGANGMPSLSISVISGNSYYIRVWSELPENQGNFDICFQSACAPSNDLPCDAVLATMGGTVTGNNTCAGGGNEPSNSAQCIAGGATNTVWYKAVVPSSGQVRVRTHPLSLKDTQLQGFLFPTGCNNALSSYINKGCNDDGTSCSGGFNDFSELLFAGLTPGDTLFVAVDGVNSLTGTFEITFIDGITTVYPPISQQDCEGAQIICNPSTFVVADPGFRNSGNICDLPTGYGCFFNGERNSVWYQFTVDPAASSGNANVSFDITSHSSTNIDFILWDITGVASACPQIQAQSMPILRCNSADLGNTTGLMNNGTGNYSPSFNFTGLPRKYLLLLNNNNSSAQAGFTFDWNNTPVVQTSTSVDWTGKSDSLFSNGSNWGDCSNIPSCAIDATISATSNGTQPIINTGNVSVKNLIINSGATLTIKNGAILNVCGNFQNLGNLNCEPGAIIQFSGTSLQTISGLLTGTNSFSNFEINKLSGSVHLLNDIDIKDKFSELSSTSIFNINGKYMKVGGDFNNSNGTTSFTGIGGSTVEFNGSNNQTFTNTSGSLNLNRVKMNKVSGKLYLSGVNSKMNIDSILILNSGIIVTPFSGSLEVNVKYFQPFAITGYNSSSYIDGKLRRKIANPIGPASPFLPASFDFPVGDSLSPGGYQLGNITFISSTLVNYVIGYFKPWPQLPPFGPNTQECNNSTYSNSPLLDNGYWTFERPVTPSNGTYNVTLYSNGFSNSSGNSGWSITKANLGSDPSLSASWTMFAKCNQNSSLTVTRRDSLNSAAYPGSFNHMYAIAQAKSIAPTCNGTVTTSSASCNGSSDGSATILLNLQNGASLPVTYVLNGITSQTVNSNPFTITGLPAGAYTLNYVTSDSCSNSVNFVIQQPPNISTTFQTQCDSFFWNGNYYSSSGLYTAHIITPNGCDSIATLALTIKVSTSSTANISACENYTWNGKTYSQTGIYFEHFLNAVGCDSTATLNLTINHNTTDTLSVNACDSIVLPWNQVAKVSGTYTHNYISNFGCDSIILYQVTVHPSPIAFITTGGSITLCNDDSVLLTSNNASEYLWSNGSTTQSIFATDSGNYYVIIKDSNNCTSTSPEVILIKNACPLYLHLKAYFQGFYLGGDSLKSVINPVDFPAICDIVSVELHYSTAPFNIFYISSGIINSLGLTDIYFPSQVYNKTLFIVLKHRNSLATWSKDPIHFNSSNIYYDFTTSPNQSYGDNMADLFDGKFGILSGDINQDGAINSFDLFEIDYFLEHFYTGYLNGDLTGDWLIESADYSILENNLGKFTLHP